MGPKAAQTKSRSQTPLINTARKPPSLVVVRGHNDAVEALLGQQEDFKGHAHPVRAQSQIANDWRTLKSHRDPAPPGVAR